MPADIPLWKRFSEDHWLRKYGQTEIIVIDDIWNNEQAFILTKRERQSLERSLNVSFHFFNPPLSNNWNTDWLKEEMERASVTSHDY